MAISSFIPKVWSARMLYNYERALVLGALCNRSYEGEIAQYGDTVHINSLAELTVKPYTPNADIDNPERLSGSDETLTIDHGAYYNFYLNDVDAAQAREDLMDAAMRAAAQRLAEDAEDYLAQVIAQGAGNRLSAPLTGENVYAKLVQLKTLMDEKNVPRAGRFVVVPPVVEGEMLLDARFIAANGQPSEERLVNGAVARAAGFDIYVSNALHDQLFAFTRDCVAFAQQLTKTEAYRREKGFDDGVKGLSLCGAKVVLPQYVFVCALCDAPALGELTVTPSAGGDSTHTRLAVAPAKADEKYLYKYRLGAAEEPVVYGQNVRYWKPWNGEDEIACESGQTLTLVECDSGYNAQRAGSALVVTGD